MASRPGHSYSNIHNADNSRNHYGDAYYQYGPSPDQQAFRAVLDSLRYDGMDDRLNRLNSAERGTFEWALAGRDVEAGMEHYEESGVEGEKGEDSERDDGSDEEHFDTNEEEHASDRVVKEPRHDEDKEEHMDDEDHEESTDGEDYEESPDDEDDESEACSDDSRQHTGIVSEAFTSWLVADEENDGLFCFMGKPGSGKSTLMKYLATSYRVDQFLDQWTAGNAAIRAEHFFWILGDPVQKSREGLLRHLLYSALQSLPANGLELAKRVCGSRRLSSHSQRAWSYEELYDMLVRFVTGSKAKFFFLVDALDECDPQDLHDELAEEITRISKLPNIKMCVSCRPWNAFASKLQTNHTVRLHEMTYHDMELYIERRLGAAGGENELCCEFIDHPRTERVTKFVADFACAAEGVFLWTELAVRALSSELRKGVVLERLQEILKAFPVGLDQYFQQLIFDRITKTRQNTSDTAAALTLALKIAEGGESDKVENDLMAQP
jgi:hypothetical protein